MSILKSLKLRAFCGTGFFLLVVYNAGLYPVLVNLYLDVIMPLPKTPQMEELQFEASLNTSQLIAYYGYPVEEYSVETDDGYLLTLQRIPGKKNGKRPILIMHGMSCSATTWVDNRNESLGFILSNEGFDVWLGNLRGSINSLHHVTLTAEDPEFWNFSIDKLAYYDMPTMIDFIISKTNQEKILLIGHSMGTTASFAMFAIRPEYNERVHGFAALAPVTTVSYMTSVLRKLVTTQNLLMTGAQLINLKYVYKPTPLLKETVMHFCGGSNPYWCSSMYPTMSGYNPYFYNKTRVAIYGTHCAAGLSVDVFLHYGQLAKSKGEFRFFDYMDEHKNMMKYGSPSPPAYNLSLVTVPTALFWGTNDALADPVDIALLLKKLPKVVLNYRIPEPMFNHYNFMWTFNMRNLLSNKLNEMLLGFDGLNSSKS